MRVLMVTPSYHPIKGGAETVIENLSTKLNQVGVQTDLLTFNMNHKWKPYWKTEKTKIDGLTAYRVAGLNWFPFTHSERITMGLNLIPGQFRNITKAYDVLHFHVGDLSFPIFSYRLKKPKIAHFHGPLDHYKKNLLTRHVLRTMADMYVAISHSMQNDLKELGIPPSKIRLVNNAVDTNFFKPNGIKERNLILFVGRVTSGKGVHVLLDALPLIKTRTHVVIIGPPDWDQSYFRKIEKNVNLENRRNFHKIDYLGEQEPYSIAKWCQKASVFVLPSFREACGLAILEAMSCKTPVVASDIEGIREVVEDGSDGILVPTNNHYKLASSIQTLLDNKAKRETFGEKGRERVIKEYSYQVAIEKFRKIYEELSS
jgi:glycosyltransferase involved in cell wall biosynthesis